MSFNEKQIRIQEEIFGLSNKVAETVVQMLIDAEPASEAIIVTGSYARGAATEGSDLDVTALTTAPGRRDYRTWLLPFHGGLLHVSAGVKSVEAWLARDEQPARWSLGLPALDIAKYVWATDEARGLIGPSPSIQHPAAELELEDFFEGLLKAKKAAREKDEIGLRWSARQGAELAPRLVLEANAPKTVTTPREALDVALGLPNAPEHYREDLGTCLGVVEAPAADVALAADRLGKEVLAFARERIPHVAEHRPNLSEYLADGTLEAYFADH
jgi:hypothetical protein